MFISALLAVICDDVDEYYNIFPHTTIAPVDYFPRVGKEPAGRVQATSPQRLRVRFL
jgi:hypothetical protein